MSSFYPPNIPEVKKSFCLMGKECIVPVFVSRMWLSEPFFNCTFKSSPSCLHCKTQLIQIPSTNTVKINKKAFLLNANITEYGNGDIICNITDTIDGFINYTSKVVFTDKLADGITVSGPPVIFKGDNVTIQCLIDDSMDTVSEGKIRWYYQNSNESYLLKEKKNGLVISDESSFIQSRYSIIIKNISNKYNGNYICGRRNKDGQIIGKTFSVTVYDKAVADGYIFFAFCTFIIVLFLSFGYTYKLYKKTMKPSNTDYSQYSTW